MSPTDTRQFLFRPLVGGEARIAECDAARALLARGYTGMVKLLDANTGMHRSTVNIKRAAEHGPMMTRADLASSVGSRFSGANHS
jgi:hypothetical protein